jgi:hypothetical protein
MPGSYQAQSRDLTKQYLGFDRTLDTYRPLGGVTFTPGLLVALASLDLQTYPDQSTVQLTGTGAGVQLIQGAVADIWPGFGGSIGSPNYTSATNQNTARGSQGVDAVTSGYHPAVYIDQSGTGAVTITNGIPIVASRATAGYGQGVAAASAPGGLGTAGVAWLPASGLGSSLTAAALVQASATDTLTGTPATGDVLSVTIQAPYNTTSPGVAQTLTFTNSPLTSAQATSVTTAAAALAAFLNSQPAFSQYFTATSAAGVVTVTVNALATPFQVTYGSGSYVSSQFSIGLSGVVGNSLSFAVATVSGATVSTASGAAFTGGTGFKGTIPMFIAGNS